MSIPKGTHREKCFQMPPEIHTTEILEVDPNPHLSSNSSRWRNHGRLQDRSDVTSRMTNAPEKPSIAWQVSMQGALESGD